MNRRKKRNHIKVCFIQCLVEKRSSSFEKKIEDQTCSFLIGFLSLPFQPSLHVYLVKYLLCAYISYKCICTILFDETLVSYAIMLFSSSKLFLFLKIFYILPIYLLYMALFLGNLVMILNSLNNLVLESSTTNFGHLFYFDLYRAFDFFKYSFLSFHFLFWCGHWTQAVAHAKHTLYHWATPILIFIFFSYFFLPRLNIKKNMRRIRESQCLNLLRLRHIKLPRKLKRCKVR